MARHHDRLALYGAATGRPVYILAVTHWRIVAGQIADEVTVFDETALLRQIEGAFDLFETTHLHRATREDGFGIVTGRETLRDAAMADGGGAAHEASKSRPDRGRTLP